MKRRCISGTVRVFALLLIAGLTASNAQAQTPATATISRPKPEYPPHTQVLADYVKVVSTADGKRSLYTLYKHKKDPKILAELPASFASQRYFLALTTASGEPFAGLQSGELYFYWRQFGTRLAMIEPNVATRSTGDTESKASVKRLFTDRVILDTRILTRGPSGGPVIDLTSILVNQSYTFFGSGSRVTNPYLTTIKKAKAFPKNVEISFEAPTLGGFDSVAGTRLPSGTLKTLHYSLSLISSSPGYRPRAADTRIGYFTTSYSDLGKYKDTDVRTRYINRWHLAKRDPKLTLSPPVKPITFILEHTVPVRYRRWISQGVLYWNKAFEKIGFLNAIEVDYQDVSTGRNMDLDAEDVRYNFIRWLNNDVGTAIGPSRVNPLTGEILDADIILTDGWIRHYHHKFTEVLPSIAMEGATPELLAWYARHPSWDPRVQLAAPSQRPQIIRSIQQQSLTPLSGHPAGKVDNTLLGDDLYDGLIGRTSQKNGMCMLAQGKRLDIGLMSMEFALLAYDDKKKDEKKEEKKDATKDEADEKDASKNEKSDKDKPEPKKPKAKTSVPMLDNMPEVFIGPLLSELVAHEVGHTLGLRHNFKSSSIYDLKTINSDDVKQKKTLAGSVMDYLPINMGAGKNQEKGDWSMIGIGPYDEWAIEYGYTLASDLKPILARVNEPELVFGTDEERGGPDPRTRVYDFGKDPLAYANTQMELVKAHREKIIDGFVKDGESWGRARHAYELTLALQTRSLTTMSRWLGGAFVSRAKKGDKNSTKPIEAVPVENQRAALKFVIDNSFEDGAFGLTPELLAHLSVDKWLDDASAFSDEATWPVHDRIAGIQASTLSSTMNPTTLRRVYDNELLIPPAQDAVTIPELMSSLTAAIWSEVEKPPKRAFTARVPMVSSLRRNLQQEHLDRLIDLSLPGGGRSEASKPISNIASLELDTILTRVEKVLTDGRKKVDPYTLAHLAKVKEQIDKVKDGTFIYNADDVGGGGGGFPFFIFQKAEDPDVNE